MRVAGLRRLRIAVHYASRQIAAADLRTHALNVELFEVFHAEDIK